MAAPVYAVPVLDAWLVVSPLHGVSALVNRAALSEFPAALAEALAAPPEPEPRPRSGPVSPQFLGLIPTRACNLSCAYCGFGSAAPGGERMDPGLAVAAIDWMADCAAREGRQALDVHFFGGEPFSAPEVVETAVHRTRAAAARKGLSPRLEVSTNGVFDERRAQWAGDYFSAIVLSFDGFREVHDRHRPASAGRGSFDQVAQTAHVLSAAFAETAFRVCVAADNVDQLEETVDWFTAEFRPSAIDFETLQPTAESHRAGLRTPDPYVFAASFRRAQSLARRRGVKPVYAAADAADPRLSFCPVGNDALILHPNGKVSACYLRERDWEERGLDLFLGSFSAAGGMDLPAGRVEAARRLPAVKPRCENCFCRWSCAGGCHVNHSCPGCAAEYDDFCVQTRVITACALLDGLGKETLAGELVRDREAMRRLALLSSDRLEDGGRGE
jgi:uncharacterized protein